MRTLVWQMAMLSCRAPSAMPRATAAMPVASSVICGKRYSGASTVRRPRMSTSCPAGMRTSSMRKSLLPVPHSPRLCQLSSHWTPDAGTTAMPNSGNLPLAQLLHLGLARLIQNPHARQHPVRIARARAPLPVAADAQRIALAHRRPARGEHAADAGVGPGEDRPRGVFGQKPQGLRRGHADHRAPGAGGFMARQRLQQADAQRRIPLDAAEGLRCKHPEQADLAHALGDVERQVALLLDLPGARPALGTERLDAINQVLLSGSVQGEKKGPAQPILKTQNLLPSGSRK